MSDRHAPRCRDRLFTVDGANPRRYWVCRDAAMPPYFEFSRKNKSKRANCLKKQQRRVFVRECQKTVDIAASRRTRAIIGFAPSTEKMQSRHGGGFRPISQ